MLWDDNLAPSAAIKSEETFWWPYGHVSGRIGQIPPRGDNFHIKLHPEVAITHV